MRQVNKEKSSPLIVIVPFLLFFVSIIVLIAAGTK